MEKANNYKWIYGNDVEYVNGKYILKDTALYSPMTFRKNAETGFDAHRYTCFTTEDSCTSVNYLYYNTYYIKLTDGRKIDDALNEMVSNENNSTIKTMIDDWYSKSMTNYTKYLEDTVWCNDRSISANGGWNKDSTTGSSGLYFGGRERNVASYKPSIECPNLNDSFTVSSEVGNGKLTYPVALLTADEVTLAGSGSKGYSKSNYLYTEKHWFLLSPNDYTEYDAYVFYEDASGYLNSGYRVNYSFGVRPSISLAPGIMIGYGNGTSNLPYEVFLLEID
ncbi:MAG: hypothetical protein HFG48_00385 [Bacilli bacterium]|nr:hypothetical protein [Bacilli bacterium]